MKNFLFFLICAFFLSFNPTSGQILNTLSPKKNALSYSNGIYGKNVGITLGYAHGVHINLFNLVKDDITLFIDLSDKTNFNNRNDFRFVYGGQTFLFRIKSFKALFRKTFTISRIYAQSVKGTYLGAEFELMPGIYKEKYFCAADIYYGDSFKGFVADQHHLLSDVSQGWIKPHQSILRFGINAGYYIKPNLCLYGSVNIPAINPKHNIYLLSRSQEVIGINYILK